MRHVRSPELDGQLLSLSTLIQLGKRARHAAAARELFFAIVNETHSLVPYRQAVLWRHDRRGVGRIEAISGTPMIERNAPFTLWLKQTLAGLDKGIADRDSARMINADALTGALREEWSEWLPANALWAPFSDTAGRPLGALLLAREEEWTESERYLVQEVADAYAHSWAALERRSSRSLSAVLRRRSALVKLALAAVIAGALMLPISLSALSPAEVVPFQPTVVRAPLDGVVDRFAVQPNEHVRKNQLLLELDRRAIENKLEVARQALAVAEAEYRQASQQAVFDGKSRAQLAVLKGRMDQRRADVTYAQSLLDRIQVTAVRDGIALFSDPNDWIGRPVTIGERLMEIADPEKPELEIWLAVPDAIALNPGTEVELFLNIAPGAPLRARLRQTSYEAAMSPAGVLGYRLKAELIDPKELPRIGLRGTAKIYGDRVTVFYYLMRRPLAAARQMLGL